MTDCPNVEMRERLPDLLHDALDASDRAEVEAHLAGCADCAAELAVLQSAHRVLSTVRIPSIDTASIVTALPRPMAPRVVRTEARRSRTLFRIAAAVSFISLGGISVAVARSFFGDVTPTSIDSMLAVGGESLQSVSPVTGGPNAGSQSSGGAPVLTMHPSVGALDDADLETLLDELDQLEALPMAEPETTPGGRAVASAVLGS